MSRIRSRYFIKRTIMLIRRYVLVFYILIFVLAFTQAALDLSVSKISLPRSKFGQFTLQKRLDSLYRLNLPDCAKECLYVTRCKSFQFDKTKGKCTLNQINSTEVEEDRWEEDSNYIFSDRRNWPKAISGSCASEPCSSKEKCLPSYPPTCVVYCGVPPGRENGEFLESCITLGCVLRYVCDEGFISTGQDMSITCQSNSTWTPYKFECIANCGPPPLVINATVGPGQETGNASRTYTCQEPYTPSSPSTSIFCQGPANWTAPEFECIL